MRKRLIISLLAAGVMALGAGPALADGMSGSSEHHTECTDPTLPDTCSEVYDNQVTCGTPSAAAPTPVGEVVVSGTGDPSTGGELEVCTDDGAVMQGRIIAGGGPGAGGGYIIVDGDASNSPEQAQGFLRVDGSSGGVTVRCGDSLGHKDGTEPEPTDGQDDCG